MRRAGSVDGLCVFYIKFQLLFLEVSQPGKRAGSPNGLSRLHVIASKRASSVMGLKMHNTAYTVSLHPRVAALFTYNTNLNSISVNEPASLPGQPVPI